MQELAVEMLRQAHVAVPVVFEDLYQEFVEQEGV